MLGLVVEDFAVDHFVFSWKGKDGGEEGDRYSVVVEFSYESQCLGAYIQLSCSH